MSETKLFARRYSLEKEIARGPFTIVYRARDEVLARTVAIKVARDDVAAPPEFERSLRARAIAAAGLAHPNIAATYDTGAEPEQEGGAQYVVLEFCPRGTLEDLLKSPLPSDRVIEIGLELCDALAYAHASGIVHGDLHPRNVLLADDGTIKITDFGHWRAAAEDSPDRMEPFLAPERNADTADDPRLDVYSTGALLYAAATGQAPARRAAGVPPHPRAVRADVPRSIDGAVARALSPDPAARHPDISALHAELAAARPPISSATRRVHAPARRESERSGSDLRWLAPVVGLIVVAVALSFLLPEVLREEDNGGPGSSGGSGGRSASNTIAVAGVDDFDPHGDDLEEHSELASAAADGDSGSYWTTESYSAALSAQGKAGVGLVFDLGRARDVSGVEIVGAEGCDLELRAAMAPASDETGFRLIESLTDASGESPLSFEPVRARYWLVWITSLAGDGGGQARIQEVRFSGS